MKKLIEKRSEAELLETHPIRGKTAGWFFRVWEASPGHWKIEGVDAWSRKVASEGADPDELLSEAETEARRIAEAERTG